MNEEIPIYVRLGSREEEWKILVEGEGPWDLRLESSNGVETSATADNVFAALQEMRVALAPKGVALCCNGARVDVRPSPQSASYGAWMVYVLHMWRPPTVRDLVSIFGCCAERISSIEEQDAYWSRHLARRKSWVNFVNPLWWIYLFTASWGNPKKEKCPRAS